MSRSIRRRTFKPKHEQITPANSKDVKPRNTLLQQAMTVQDTQRPLLRITTFGHRNGPLSPSPELLFDLRAVPNPPKELRTAARQTGQIGPMQEWLFSLGPVRQLFHDIRHQIFQRLREAEVKGVKCVDVGLGCNLGRNRSVTIAEALVSLDWEGWRVVVRHRDLGLEHAGKDLARPIIPSLRHEVTTLLANDAKDE